MVGCSPNTLAIWIMARPMGVEELIPCWSQYNRMLAASSSARAFSTWSTLRPSQSIDQTVRMSLGRFCAGRRQLSTYAEVECIRCTLLHGIAATDFCGFSDRSGRRVFCMGSILAVEARQGREGVWARSSGIATPSQTELTS